MNMIKRPAGILLLVLLASCGDNESAEQKTTTETAEVPAAVPAASVKDMQWLTGWWQNVTPGGTVFEAWEMNGEALTGKGGFIKGSDTMISETIVLEQQGSDLVYLPTVKDQNDGRAVPFKLTMAAADSFVFENPQHDFPSKIVYKKISETALVARISGKIEGKEQAEAFELTKVQ